MPIGFALLFRAILVSDFIFLGTISLKSKKKQPYSVHKFKNFMQ